MRDYLEALDQGEFALVVVSWRKEHKTLLATGTEHSCCTNMARVGLITDLLSVLPQAFQIVVFPRSRGKDVADNIPIIEEDPSTIGVALWLVQDLFVMLTANVCLTHRKADTLGFMIPLGSSCHRASA